jgi:glycosyltransferase involved in cell wall biosynthesis
MYKITIIIPVYNVQNYIERCIDSIIAQESKNYHLECVLVNDCTPDRSMDIIDYKLNGYSGNIEFIVVNHDNNKGLSASRNTGIQNASGDYVLFVDSDDRLEKDALPNLVNALDNTNTKSLVDVVMGNTFVCKNKELAMHFDNASPFFIDNSHEQALKSLLRRRLFHTAWNKLIRRDFLINNNIVFEEGILDEDLLWSYYLFLHARGVIIIPKVTYIYEDNPGSIMNTSSDKISLIIQSRIVSCSKILTSPPKFTMLEYNMYFFFVMARAIDLFEQNKSSVNQLKKDLYHLRNTFLLKVLKKGYLIQFLFFVTSVKPFYYIYRVRWFRRYFDKIASKVLNLSIRIHK